MTFILRNKNEGNSSPFKLMKYDGQSDPRDQVVDGFDVDYNEVKYAVLSLDYHDDMISSADEPLSSFNHYPYEYEVAGLFITKGKAQAFINGAYFAQDANNPLHLVIITLN